MSSIVETPVRSHRPSNAVSARGPSRLKVTAAAADTRISQTVSRVQTRKRTSDQWRMDGENQSPHGWRTISPVPDAKRRRSDPRSAVFRDLRANRMVEENEQFLPTISPKRLEVAAAQAVAACADEAAIEMVLPQLFLGSAASAVDEQRLSESGITHVVELRSDTGDGEQHEPVEVLETGADAACEPRRYLRFDVGAPPDELPDHYVSIISQCVERMRAWHATAADAPGSVRIAVCADGPALGPAITVAFCALHCDMSLASAVSLVCERRAAAPVALRESPRLTQMLRFLTSHWMRMWSNRDVLSQFAQWKTTPEAHGKDANVAAARLLRDLKKERAKRARDKERSRQALKAERDAHRKAVGELRRAKEDHGTLKMTTAKLIHTYEQLVADDGDVSQSVQCSESIRAISRCLTTGGGGDRSDDGDGAYGTLRATGRGINWRARFEESERQRQVLESDNEELQKALAMLKGEYADAVRTMQREKLSDLRTLLNEVEVISERNDKLEEKLKQKEREFKENNAKRVATFKEKMKLLQAQHKRKMAEQRAALIGGSQPETPALTKSGRRKKSSKSSK